MIATTGIPFELKLPHVAFHRHIGEFRAPMPTSPARSCRPPSGRNRRTEFLPSEDDGDFIESLMQPEVEPGQYASWIAPPKVGIDNKPGEFEYVKIADA